jgi:hypothetical protein
MAFQSDAFQNDAFQVAGGARTAALLYMRRYLNDLESADVSTHSVSFSVSITKAGVITYIRRYLNDIS